MSKKREKTDYLRQLAEVELSSAHAQLLMAAVSDNRRTEQQKFYRVRDVIFEALVRQTLGEAEYSKLCLSAVQKSRTVMGLVKEKNDAKRSD